MLIVKMTLMVGIYSMEMKSTQKNSVWRLEGAFIRKKGFVSHCEGKRRRIQETAVHQMLDILFLPTPSVRYYYSYFIFEETEARGLPRI